MHFTHTGTKKNSDCDDKTVWILKCLFLTCNYYVWFWKLKSGTQKLHTNVIYNYCEKMNNCEIIFVKKIIIFLK